MTKGIILAAGSGSRLLPVTKYINKHLLPVNDKPMIFYPLSILMLAGVKDILIIVNPDDIKNYELLLGDGSSLGIKIKYEIQLKPNGIAEALNISKSFIKRENFFLILGDNFFYGQYLQKFLYDAQLNKRKATLFVYPVQDTKEYGIITLNKNKIVKIIEKPKKTNSNLAVTGLYYFPNEVIKIYEKLKPSKRGELEITDVNNLLIKKNKVELKLFGRGFAWLDMGTFENLLETGLFIQTIEKRQGFKIGVLEEIALKQKFINITQFKKLIIKNKNHKKYLNKILNSK